MTLLLPVSALTSLLAVATTQATPRPHRHSPLPHWLLHLGLPGLFALSVLDSSVIPLPLPGSTDLLLLLLVAQHGSHPILLAAAAIVGSVAGGYLTWSTGRRGGEAMLKRWAPKRLVGPLTKWVSQRGFTTVAVSALLPPPVPLMPLLLGAGALGVSRRKFLIGLSAARLIRYGFVAWVGVTYGRRVLHWWNLYLADWSSTILGIFFGLLAAAIGFGVWKYRQTEGSAQREAASAAR
jgi:membrane protein YqaA with SNARE-associated domain